MKIIWQLILKQMLCFAFVNVWLEGRNSLKLYFAQNILITISARHKPRGDHVFGCVIVFKSVCIILHGLLLDPSVFSVHNHDCMLKEPLWFVLKNILLSALFYPSLLLAGR